MKILDLVPSWMYAGIIAVLLAFGVGQHVKLSNARVSLADEQRDRAKEKTAAAIAALKASQAYRSLEQDHAKKERELRDAYDEDVKKRDDAARTAALDAGRLRDKIRTFTTGGRVMSEADTAICKDISDRAATLGNLLEQADSLAEGFAGKAEQHADEVRVLKRQIQADRELFDKK